MQYAYAKAVKIMKVNMATQTKKPQVRAVVGSTKKSNGLHFTKRAVLIGLVAIVALSVAAGLGWQQWQNHQLKAKAAGWTNTYSYCAGGGCATARVCKMAVTSAYGPLWQFKHYVTNTSSDTITHYQRTKRGTSVVGTSTVYAPRITAKFGEDIFASRVYNDTFESRIVGYQNGRYVDSGYVWMPIDSIAYC